MSHVSDALKAIDLGGLAEVLAALAHEDALKIFIAAQGGIEKSTQVIQELELTQKRYYSRLSELMNAGLVEKRENAYRHTTVGAICYTLGKSVTTALAQRDHLDLMDRVRQSQSFSATQTTQILRALAPRDLTDSLRVGGLISPVRLLEEEAQLVAELVTRIEGAAERIYLAIEDPEARVLEALLKAVQRKIELVLLTGISHKLSDRLQALPLILNPGGARAVLDLLLAQELQVRQGAVPFTVAVIDGRWAVIAVVDPVTHDFQVGFTLESPAVCRRLVETFDSLFDQATEDPLVAYLKKQANASTSTKTSVYR